MPILDTSNKIQIISRSPTTITISFSLLDPIYTDQQLYLAQNLLEQIIALSKTGMDSCKAIEQLTQQRNHILSNPIQYQEKFFKGTLAIDTVQEGPHVNMYTGYLTYQETTSNGENIPNQAPSILYVNPSTNWTYLELLFFHM